MPQKDENVGQFSISIGQMINICRYYSIRGIEMKKFLFSILASLIFIGVGVFMIAMPKAFLGILVIIFSIFYYIV